MQQPVTVCHTDPAPVTLVPEAIIAVLASLAKPLPLGIPLHLLNLLRDFLQIHFLVMAHELLFRSIELFLAI